VRNQFPVAHYMRAAGNVAWDYIGINYHGLSNTHIDAFCHIATEEGGQLYNGRPASDVRITGARSGSIDKWRDGIVTRGVLYDIPPFRGVEYVTLDQPVHGWELEDCAKAQGVEPRPGDAVLIRSGSESWWRDAAGAPATGGSQTVPGVPERPGVHPSALEFFHKYDTSILVWDLQDAGGLDYAQPGGGAIHYIALPFMGMPLLDNAFLDPLGEACAQTGAYEFMFMCAPLVVWGGTGSPVNPLAVL
jgi:kynurenine formamidase